MNSSQRHRYRCYYSNCSIHLRILDGVSAAAGRGTAMTYASLMWVQCNDHDRKPMENWLGRRIESMRCKAEILHKRSDPAAACGSKVFVALPNDIDKDKEYLESQICELYDVDPGLGFEFGTFIRF
eukprot:5372-Amphidinium_carterae.1